MINIEDVMKLDLRVAEILEAEAHPDADRLVVLQIAIGEDKRQIVAGIRKAYEVEELVGKKIVVIANLEPVKLRGVESQGMLLAAKDDATLALLTVDKDITSGSRVK